MNKKEFKSFSRYNIYNNKWKIKKIIYKCANIRKDKILRRATGQSVFCNTTIKFIESSQNVISGYFIKKFHSEECEELDIKKIRENIKIKIEKDAIKLEFNKLCIEFMDNTIIYDRRLYKEELKKIYISKKYYFPLNDNLLSIIITN